MSWQGRREPGHRINEIKANDSVPGSQRRPWDSLNRTSSREDAIPGREATLLQFASYVPRGHVKRFSPSWGARRTLNHPQATFGFRAILTAVEPRCCGDCQGIL